LPASTLPPPTTRRALILHDSLTFLTLALVALVLFVVTLFLFRSFEGHRDDLARRWSTRGRQQLQQGKPDQAVASLRAALTYDPDNLAYQLLLAESLAASGHLDQASAYFLNLWATRPGDGFINLQLARLTRRKGDAPRTIEYYRAAIFGDWQTDGILQRRAVRLELIDYLLQRGDLPAARTELHIVVGNAPNDSALNLLVGRKFLTASDPIAALAAFRRSIAADPKNGPALEAAGRLAYTLGDYGHAHAWLRRAIQQDAAPDTPASKAHIEELSALAADASRSLDLSLSRDLPARERATHILTAWKIAQSRIAACAATSSPPQPAMQELQARWQTADKPTNRRVLVENATAQDSMTQLIYDTEVATAQTCGQPTGDDALLLQLARAFAASQNGAAQ
jgi:Tfp pilus assembly protein PilF